MHTEMGEKPGEDTGRREPPASQAERPLKTSALLQPCSLQNGEKRNVSCLSHPVCGLVMAA